MNRINRSSLAVGLAISLPLCASLAHAAGQPDCRGAGSKCAPPPPSR